MKFLSRKQVREEVLYSFAHIARLEAAGSFPKRVELGPGRVGWVGEEIEDWCRARIADRDNRSRSP